MRRGEVWVANLNPARGRETGKTRPVLVVQADELLEAGTPTVVILPLTTRMQPQLRLLRVTLPARDLLQQECQVLVDQPRTVDRRRFGDGPLTRLTQPELAAVELGLRIAVGLF